MTSFQGGCVVPGMRQIGRCVEPSRRAARRPGGQATGHSSVGVDDGSATGQEAAADPLWN